MYRTVTILLLLISLTSRIHGQQTENVQPSQTIRGTVIDKASGHPMPNVTILLPDIPGTGSTTDGQGQFSVSNIPIGRHTIQATFLGYEPSVFREILVTSAKEVYLDIALKENVKELGEVIVRPQVNKEQPLNKMAATGARMLSVEEASRYAGGMDDPARLVSSFAGVAANVSSNGISIHGNAPHLLQWRMEDVEIPNPNHFADLSILGGGILSSLSSLVLGNSDFFTGAFPAEYGNAVSGVFDMKLRNGNSRKVENTVQVGVLGLDVASEGPLSKQHRASYIFNYRYSTTGLLNRIYPGLDLGGTLDYQDLNFKLNFPTRKAGTFSIWGTSLIDSYEDDFDEDPKEWEHSRDNFQSKAKQYMASGGVSHRYFFSNDATLKTTLATTYSGMNATEHAWATDHTSTPFLIQKYNNTNLILTSAYNRKFSARHTNQTGFTYTRMFYNMRLNLAPFETAPLNTVSKGKGQTGLINLYTSSSFGITDRLTLNAGLSSQLLTLNNSRTLEPRVGLKWTPASKASFALAYGLHSRMEKMDVYFVNSKSSGQEQANKDLGFTKAHHLMLTFGYKLSDNLLLKVEPYAQFLYNVPVIADSSYSVLNRREFYVEEALVNKGKGRNLGVDITLEKYLDKGLYYLITASVFDSRYKGGDGVWHNTRYNRRFILNTLVGKELMVGANKQNMLSANVKLTLQGGERYSPLDMEATMAHPDKEAQYDETRAYSQQYPTMFIANFTVSYKINRRKVAHEFAVKALNVTGTKEYYGYHYNLKDKVMELNGQSIPISNISYKLEF
ncbi:TonB-dependent receptor [Parabacteroides bouchesdurhonensis]|uniref:TonB-dependent receptor n=1 Tax=Parabacteroides bouchesdurhonensis TaxID=1936995 RepID=UPI000E4BD34D|nr:carboxypeptidase-like regulatory domain-containing protein [Parabacteroides bouchesdurhonensis]RHJ90226.1 carboxypeptidase-like regulatory domain-containing protein [Bacteroides sp. AM07-16]